MLVKGELAFKIDAGVFKTLLKTNRSTENLKPDKIEEGNVILKSRRPMFRNFSKHSMEKIGVP